MELLQLRYFLECANTENISKTAQSFSVSPSSVSSSIKKLENELECKLFDHDNNHIYLNENGRIFQNAINNVFKSLDTVVTELNTMDTAVTENLSILIRSNRDIALTFLKQFHEKYRNIHFTIQHDFSKNNYNSYDIIVDECSDKYVNFIGTPLKQEKIKVAASSKNPLCDQKLHLKDLHKESFLVLSEGSSLNRLTKDYCRKAGFNPNIVITSDNPTYIRNYLAWNFGISLVPESWNSVLDDTIKYLDIVDLDASRLLYIYQNKYKLSNRAANLFKNELISYIQKL